MDVKDITVSLIQSDIAWNDYEKNLESFQTKIDEIDQQTDLIILPEMFTTGFSMDPAPIAQSMNGPSVEWMRSVATSRQTSILGSLVITEAGKYYNRLVWVESNGQVHSYNKMHLFSFAGEDNSYSPGQENLIIQLKGWRISTYICYDLRFPVWSRNHSQGYDMAIYVANWPERRARHWNALLLARAIENQSYVIGLNRVGTDGNDISYVGDSKIIDPLGEILFHSHGEESVHTHTLSKRALEDTRATFPFLKDADSFQLLSQRA